MGEVWTSTQSPLTQCVCLCDDMTKKYHSVLINKITEI